MYEYYENYKKADGNADAQGRWARQLTWEVARHAGGTSPQPLNFLLNNS